MAPYNNVNHTRRQKRARAAVAAWQIEIMRLAMRIGLQFISASASGTPRCSHLITSPLVFLPRVDILDDPSSPTMVAIFELPGVRRDQISITISHGILHVRGRRVQRSPRECGAVSNSLSAASVESPSPDNCASQASVRSPVQELRYGYFGRGVKLPEGIREVDLTTWLNDGLFIVTWPRQAKATQM